MVSVKRLVLDVLKPHHPNALEFTRTIAEVGSDYRVHLMVSEVDEKTETLQVIIEGESVDFEAIERWTQTAPHTVNLHKKEQLEVVA